MVQVSGRWNLQCPKRPIFLACVRPYCQSTGCKWVFFVTTQVSVKLFFLFFATTLVSVEIVLGVNTAMKEFEREQELAAFYNMPKDDRVDDVDDGDDVDYIDDVDDVDDAELYNGPKDDLVDNVEKSELFPPGLLLCNNNNNNNTTGPRMIGWMMLRKP